MPYEVKVVLDSLAPCGKRLTTITATYPRFIHSEILTHRDRARNSASSRAIPFPVMSERIEADPVIPLQWLCEQSGMQGGAEIPKQLRPLAEAIWRAAMADAMRHAKALYEIGKTAHKYVQAAENGDQGLVGLGDYVLSESQICDMREECYADDQFLEDIKIHKSIPNRIVEPWMWMTVIMTTTEWKNFFRLRCHGDAEIHFQKIAGMIRDALNESVPFPLDAGSWHLPFCPDLISLREKYGMGAEGLEAVKKISAARCARVSYLTHDGVRDPDKDIQLFERLSNGSGFGHWSPMEHVAEACDYAYDGDEHNNKRFVRSGPFVGWKQFRKEFALENQEG